MLSRTISYILSTVSRDKNAFFVQFLRLRVIQLISNKNTMGIFSFTFRHFLEELLGQTLSIHNQKPA